MKINWYFRIDPGIQEIGGSLEMDDSATKEEIDAAVDEEISNRMEWWWEKE